MISDTIIGPLQWVNPGSAEKADCDPSSKIAYVITGGQTDDKGGQVVAVDGFNNECEYDVWSWTEKVVNQGDFVAERSVRGS